MDGTDTLIEKTPENKITEGPIGRQLLAFFFPIMFGTFFQQLYNTADAVIVGNFVGKQALAAVGGPSGVLINLLVGFFVGLSSGAAVVISQLYGAKKEEDVSRAVHTAAALAIAGGLVLTVTGFLAAGPALRAMGTPEDILPHSLTYIHIYFIGMVPSLVYNMGSGILRAVGDSRRPLYYLIAACFINILLDLLLVAYLELGVAGVGIATVLSQLASALLIVRALNRSGGCLRLELKSLRFTPSVLSKMIRIGLPAGLQSVMYSFSNIIIQSSINSFGTDTVAAWTAYSKIDGLFWMIMGAFGVSITTFVGQNYGAQKYDRVKKSVRVCLALSLAAALSITALLLLLGPYVFRLFTQDAGVTAIGVKIIRLLVPCYVTYICIEILSGAVRGAGDAVVPMIMTCLGVCVLRIVWVMTVVPARHSLVTVLLSYPVTWSITSVLFILYYLNGRWLKRGRGD